MYKNRKNGAELWDICTQNTLNVCNQARMQNMDINNTIYPFKVLVPTNRVDIEDWEDAKYFITLAIYNLSLHYLSKNIPKLIKFQSQ